VPGDAVEVVVAPHGLVVRVPPGQTLMAAATAAGWRWPTVCKGSAICTRCVVQVAPDVAEALSPMEADEREALERNRWFGEPVSGERLACQARVLAPCTVVNERARPPATLEEAS
jgi:ferredoxin, 2Fe-2S